MALHIPTGAGLVAMIMEWEGDLEPMACTFGIAAAAADADDIAQEIFDNQSQGFLDCLSEVVSLTRVDITTPTTLGTSSGAAKPGTLDNNVTPQNCAVLVEKNTGLRGRSKRGRMFIPGINLARLDNAGGLLSTGRTAYQEDMTTFFSDVASIPEVEAIVLLHSDPGEAPDVMTGINIDGRAATQRRRLR